MAGFVQPPHTPSAQTIMSTALSLNALIKRFFKLTIVLIATFCHPLLSYGASDGHLGMGVLSATKKLNDTHTLYAGVGTLIENYKGDLLTIGVASKVNDAVTWRTAYFLYSPTLDGEERHYDHRLRGSLTYKYDFGDWRFSHRSRIEYRRGDVLEGFRYRPTFNLSHPLSISNYKFRHYVEYEPFYDFRKHFNTLSLYSAGVILPLAKRATLFLAYFQIHNHEYSTRTYGPKIIFNIGF